MNKNKISTRQLCFILAFFFPVNKLIILPAALGGTAGNDLLLSAGALYLLQGIAVFSILWLTKKKNQTLFSLIEERFGKVTAYIAYAVLSLFFFFSSLYPLLEQKTYVLNTMYDTRPSVIVFLPFFALSLYAATKGLTSIGRSADLALFFFLPSFILLLVMAVGSTDFTELLPIANNSFPEIVNGCLTALFAFAESAYLLVFMGHVQVEKKFLTKTMLSYGGGALGVLLFLGVFYGIFSEVSMRELYALSKIARYYNALKVIGRVDFIFIYSIEIVQLFALVIPIQLCVHTASTVLHTGKVGLVSLIVNILLLIFTLLTSNAFLAVNSFINTYCFPVFLLFSFALPILCLLFTIPKKGANIK